ncbi:MAG: hypothetical protein BJ554DRAFT_1712 [Olpidium bornovanus]|uniref:Helicase C-terminal domain-containing protein n=1 Tax=Olpidium bornovanus TaxID=278681 RepID=A0A8H8A144_9FUNG|nr:MAG: hypothetical protein BJ554DRAFT_1712 [Olpidium bornovanus]
MEIKRCVDQIRSLGKRFEVWPLHSGLTSQEQSKVFRAPVQGHRKVVVSTNVAETSITMYVVASLFRVTCPDGIVHVIDSGRVKQLQYEVTNHMLRLEETWASRASCKQRQGRAGRTRPGVCYKLYTRRMEERVLPAKTPPEILRTPLEQLCLQVKAMGHNDVKAFLSQAIDPPSTEAMDTAIGILRAFGAMDPETGKLTAMGRHMVRSRSRSVFDCEAAIPADIRISKMLIYGSVFHCLRPMLTIAACLSSRSPFMSPMEKREEAKAARDKFATGKSDLLTAAAAYDAWDRIRKTVSRSELRQFCESRLLGFSQNFLSTQTLFEIYDLRRQYLDLLRDLGFAPWKSQGQAKDDEDRLNANAANLKLVKAAICAGLYPNVARIQHPKTTYEQSLHGSIAVDPEARQIKFFTKEDGRIFLHPSTVGFSINKYEESFLVYFSKIATSKVFLRDATPVGAYPLLLFGGRLTVDHHARGIWIDGKVALRAWARIAGASWAPLRAVFGFSPLPPARGMTLVLTPRLSELCSSRESTPQSARQTFRRQGRRPHVRRVVEPGHRNNVEGSLRCVGLTVPYSPFKIFPPGGGPAPTSSRFGFREFPRLRAFFDFHWLAHRGSKRKEGSDRRDARNCRMRWITSPDKRMIIHSILVAPTPKLQKRFSGQVPAAQLLSSVPRFRRQAAAAGTPLDRPSCPDCRGLTVDGGASKAAGGLAQAPRNENEATRNDGPGTPSAGRLSKLRTAATFPKSTKPTECDAGAAPSKPLRVAPVGRCLKDWRTRQPERGIRPFSRERPALASYTFAKPPRYLANIFGSHQRDITGRYRTTANANSCPHDVDKTMLRDVKGTKSRDEEDTMSRNIEDTMSREAIPGICTDMVVHTSGWPRLQVVFLLCCHSLADVAGIAS